MTLRPQEEDTSGGEQQKPNQKLLDGTLHFARVKLDQLALSEDDLSEDAILSYMQMFRVRATNIGKLALDKQSSAINDLNTEIITLLRTLDRSNQLNNNSGEGKTYTSICHFAEFGFRDNSGLRGG
ncbi:MAG: hypothetical protein Q7R81_01195 [Candidatus Peregrinibacteria bacterium]|nr:hypothetical protein [Candidatus Peregrinibacteria bacterium]